MLGLRYLRGTHAEIREPVIGSLGLPDISVSGTPPQTQMTKNSADIQT